MEGTEEDIQVKDRGTELHTVNEEVEKEQEDEREKGEEEEEPP